MDLGFPLGFSLGRPSLESVLGSNLVEIWYAADSVVIGGEVDRVAGRKTGLLLSASGSGARPGFTAANPAFAGHPSINCKTIGNRALTNFAVPATLVPAGNRPFQWAIYRVHTQIAGTQSVFTLRCSASYEVALRLNGTTDFQSRLFDGSLRTSTSATQDTAAHIQASHVDATSGSSLWKDGALFNTVAAGTAASGAASDRIALGSNNGPGEYANAEFVVFGVCRNPPTSAQLAQLYQLAKRYGVA